MAQLAFVGSTSRKARRRPTTEARPNGAASGFAALVSRVLNARRCSLMLTDDEGNLIIEEAVGLPPYFAGSSRAALGRGLAMRVAAEGSPLVVNQPTEHSALPAACGMYSSEAFVIYPLSLPDGTTGVINVTERDGNAGFGPTELDLLADLVRFYVSTFDSRARQDVLKLRREVRRLRGREIRSLESERKRLARELHDDAGHALTAAILRIDIAAGDVSGNDQIGQTLANVRQTLHECAGHLHDLAFDLQPRLLIDLGLAPAIRSLARRAREASNLEVEVEILGTERRLDGETELAAFRIAQESITNAMKYASASRIDLELAFVADGVGIAIQDDGVGFDLDTLLPEHGTRDRHGLHGMRERAEVAGGAFDVSSSPGHGTTIRARLPIQGGPKE